VSANSTIKINLSCNDNNLLDADHFSVGSRQHIIFSWPVENPQDNLMQLDPLCNVDETTPHSCITLDPTL